MADRSYAYEMVATGTGAVGDQPYRMEAGQLWRQYLIGAVETFTVLDNLLEIESQRFEIVFGVFNGIYYVETTATSGFFFNMILKHRNYAEMHYDS